MTLSVPQGTGGCALQGPCQSWSPPAFHPWPALISNPLGLMLDHILWAPGLLCCSQPRGYPL